MVEAWIGEYKYFLNTTFPFDPFEPYSTIISLIVGIPTFVFATYVYTVLLSHPNFRGKAYFHVFIAQGFIDMLAFLTNQLRYRCSLFEAFAKFYVYLGDSAGATALCVISISMPRAQLVAQCLLSTNRLLAVSKPMKYERWQAPFSRCGALLLILVPLVVAVPDVLTGFRFGALYGVHGTVIFYSSAQKGWPEMAKFADGLATGFQFSLTIFAFLCNCVLIVAVAKMKNAKIANRGLVVTTLAQFVTHLAYAFIMVCYLYLPPSQRNALMFTSIVLDLISISPIWMLLSFSSAVRDIVLRRLTTKMIVPISDQVTTTMVVTAPSPRSA